MRVYHPAEILSGVLPSPCNDNRTIQTVRVDIAVTKLTRKEIEVFDCLIGNFERFAANDNARDAAPSAPGANDKK